MRAVPQGAYCQKDGKISRWTGAYKMNVPGPAGTTICEYRHEDGLDVTRVWHADIYGGSTVEKYVRGPHIFWLSCQAPTPHDSYHTEYPSVYIDPMPYGLDKLLALEFQRQKSGLTIVSSLDKADYRLRGIFDRRLGEALSASLISMSRVGVDVIGRNTGSFSIFGRQVKRVELRSTSPTEVAKSAAKAVEEMLTWDWSDLHPMQ
jgi:hypothetical protein